MPGVPVMTAGSRHVTCVCGHAEAAHRHHRRRAAYCGHEGCACNRYQEIPEVNAMPASEEPCPECPHEIRDGEQNDGRWRPSVPLPFFGLLHVSCHCGRRFWHLRVRRGRDRYEEHFRARHIEWTPSGPCMPGVLPAARPPAGKMPA